MYQHSTNDSFSLESFEEEPQIKPIKNLKSTFFYNKSKEFTIQVVKVVRFQEEHLIMMYYDDDPPSAVSENILLFGNSIGKQLKALGKNRHKCSILKKNKII